MNKTITFCVCGHQEIDHHTEGKCLSVSCKCANYQFHSEQPNPFYRAEDDAMEVAEINATSIAREHNAYPALVEAAKHFLELETPDGNPHVDRIRRDLLRHAPEFARYLLEVRAALEAAGETK